VLALAEDVGATASKARECSAIQSTRLFMARPANQVNRFKQANQVSLGSTHADLIGSKLILKSSDALCLVQLQIF
jgi:hypothetical protein